MSTNTLATLSEQYQALKIQIELAETDLDQAKRVRLSLSKWSDLKKSLANSRTKKTP